MTVIFFSGACYPEGNGVMCFAYSLVEGLSLNESGCGVVDGARKNESSEVAAWIALGKALALVVAARIPVKELRLIGDTKAVLDQLYGRAEPPTPFGVTLRDECLAKLKLIGVPAKGECIPRDQNLMCSAMCRAAYLGRVGNLPPAAKEKP